MTAQDPKGTLRQKSAILDSEGPKPEFLAEALRRRDAILETVNIAAEQFLRSTPDEMGISNMLERLREATQVSTAYIFANVSGEHGDLLAYPRFASTAPGYEGHEKNPLFQAGVSLPYAWQESLSMSRPVSGNSKDFSGRLSETVAEFGVVSFALVPVFVGTQWWGFIGLSEFESEHDWSTVELGALRTAANIFGAAIQRKLDEQERNRLVAAIEQAAEAVVLADPEGTVVYVNPAFEKITGFSRGEAVGRLITFFLGPDVEGFVETFGALGCHETWRAHVVGKRKDQSSYEAELSVSPVCDLAGKLTNYVALVRDVTEQVRLERQLRQAQKLEALGTLSGGLAHDFNNILMPIIGYTQLTVDELPEGSEARDSLERVLSAADRARNLIAQILAFSREAEQPRRPVRMSSILIETLKLMRASIPSTIEIRQRIDTTEDTVLADPTRIHQVLVNLFTNARLAIGDETGLLEVCLEDVEAGAEFVARNADLREGSYVRLTVSDTGCGMTADVLERLFEPFFTTRGGEGGTGLGLAVVHGIVRSFDGAIRVYSEPGHGTTFQIYLPRSKGAEEERAGPDQPIPRGTERVLFVDDEEAIVDVGQKMLEGLGYTIERAKSGQEAFERFRVDPEAFDLVVTDQTMPKMTGRSLIRRIRGLRPDIPVILTTGFSRTFSATESEALERVDVLTKPMTKRELGVAIRRALDGKEPGQGRP